MKSLISLHNPIKWVKIDGLWQTEDIPINFDNDDNDICRERFELCQWKVIWMNHLIELKNFNIKSKNSFLRLKKLKYLTDIAPGNDGFVKAMAIVIEPIKSWG